MTGVGSINGVVGRIKWAYYDAAQIEGYTVTRTGHQWSLRATVILSDAFKIAQRPLMFVAPHKHGEWRWPIVSCRIESNQLTAQLGPLET